ncbi:MAG TPA: nuclear transport factor 2 family protein [Solirubrobacterales bacterium]
MSQENIDLVRRCYELLSTGETVALLELIGPEFELHENVLAPDSAVYHGPDGLRKWLEVSRESFGEFRFEAERFIESDDWIFAPVHAHGRGRGSGAPFTARYVTAFRLAHGKVVFAASYEDLPKALEAAGLRE